MHAIAVVYTIIILPLVIALYGANVALLFLTSPTCILNKMILLFVLLIRQSYALVSFCGDQGKKLLARRLQK